MKLSSDNDKHVETVECLKCIEFDTFKEDAGTNA